MNQEKVWEREYQKSQLLTKDDKPQNDILRFLKYLKKEQNFIVENLNILDIGAGTGRNGNYLAELSNNVIGLEISNTALKLANERAKSLSVNAKYLKQDIGVPYPLENNYFDLALDVISSNSLNEAGREIYFKEVSRVLKSGGWFFVKALCKDGDDNAKNLLKISPGKEYDTYIMKELGLTERVFSREDFIKTYSPNFLIISLEKKTTYSQMNNRSYKRNFWIGYLNKR